MSQLQIETDYSAYYPGGELRASVSWQLAEIPDSAELRLVWNTSGKGDRDLKVVHVVPLPDPQAKDERNVELTLPWGPYSFSGKLISLIWALELVLQPGNVSARREITIGPEAREVILINKAETI
ncbi:MAG: hypothetical protein KDA80_21835 [Planctomycetaceae bacterium]|nr:hypothetical protein [Planctomycetaceae bacterium]